jgi:hypothetical protein
MKTLILLTITLITAIQLGCANKNKAENIETEMEKTQKVGGGENLGIKDGNMVVQRKTLMSEELRSLQIDVYEQEDRVYGNRKYGSKGIYGVLKDCRMELADKNNGGDGKLKFIEPLDRVTDKEIELKLGIDEKNELVAVSEEMLNDRIERFKKYKAILQKREDDLQDKLDICKTDLKSQKANLPK